jgi:retinol dehydrogenase-12
MTTPTNAPSPSMRAVVTGGTSGIGEATARRLLKAGAHVLIVGHDAERGAEALERLNGDGSTGTVELIIADLSLAGGVDSAARSVRNRFDSVDLLVNNAGMFFQRRAETAEGVEETWALNVLAPYRLTEALRAPLTASGNARVVNVASEAHRGKVLDFGDLECRRRYRGFRTYGRSKVALILLTQEFARRWEGSGVAFFAVHPGFVRTRFGLNNRGPVAWLIRFLGIFFAISAERGADTPVFAATSRDLDGRTGLYLSRERVVKSSSESRDARAASHLWELVRARDEQRQARPEPARTAIEASMVRG